MMLIAKGSDICSNGCIALVIGNALLHFCKSPRIFASASASHPLINGNNAKHFGSYFHLTIGLRVDYEIQSQQKYISH